jgi:hypothetical protein
MAQALLRSNVPGRNLRQVKVVCGKRAEEESPRESACFFAGMGVPLSGRSGGGLLLLCAALPLSTEDLGFSDVFRGENSVTVLEFVTPDERDLLRAMRSSLSEWAERSGSSSGTDVPLRAESTVAAVPREVERAVPARETTPSTLLVVRERAEEKEKRGTVPLEDVLALVQKGERALRKQAVPVVEESGETFGPLSADPKGFLPEGAPSFGIRNFFWGSGFRCGEKRHTSFFMTMLLLLEVCVGGKQSLSLTGLSVEGNQQVVSQHILATVSTQDR